MSVRQKSPPLLRQSVFVVEFVLPDLGQRPVIAVPPAPPLASAEPVARLRETLERRLDTRPIRPGPFRLLIERAQRPLDDRGLAAATRQVEARSQPFHARVEVPPVCDVDGHASL